MGTLLSVSEATYQLLAAFSPVESELVSLSAAYGRVLAEPILSQIDLPSFTNSSMDGFAVRSADLIGAAEHQPVILKVVEDIPAGRVSQIEIKVGEAARIMTGAVLPAGADAVIPVELTDHFQENHRPSIPKSEYVEIFHTVVPGENIRLRGQDLHAGKCSLPANIRLRPQDIGLLAMLGVAQAHVYRRPKLAMLSTGDELIPINKPLEPGTLHDSNAYTLAAQVDRDGGTTEYLGIAPDREEAVERLLDQAYATKVDLILSSAGVSVGAFDFVRSAVEKHGHIDFWRVDMRPGKPVAFGTYREIPFIGLPGNPVSAFVGYEVFVRPALMKLCGLRDFSRSVITVKLLEAVESDGRESYLRAKVTERNGEWVAQLTGHQGSGNLLSLVQANALLIIPSGVKSLPVNAEVNAWWID